jgi:uncharacterized protein YicC (UPF0701 family)
VDPDEPVTAAGLLGVIERSAQQLDELREAVEQGVARAAQADARVGELARVIAEGQRRDAERALLERLTAAQERVATLLEARDAETGRLDAETRARLRSIDTQVLRILEDMAAGRQDLVSEMRQDIAGLAEALRGVSMRGRG